MKSCSEQGETPGFDYYFTDSIHKVPYLGRRDNWFFLERHPVDYWPIDKLLEGNNATDAMLYGKENLVSFIIPNK